MAEFDDFFYPHKCVVSRSTGDTDDEGDWIITELYNGICGLQIGVNGDSTLQGDIYQRQPTLIIPILNIEFKIGDLVIVDLPQSIKEAYTVKSVKIEIGEGVEGTTLWLKKGNEQH